MPDTVTTPEVETKQAPHVAGPLLTAGLGLPTIDILPHEASDATLDAWEDALVDLLVCRVASTLAEKEPDEGA